MGESKNLEAWVDRLSASGLPIFSETVRTVSGVVSRRETSAHDLAAAIEKDASLSARLLKIANSPLFNLQHRSIETISSAVVLLGFDAVRELAVSLALIEQVLKGRSHVRVTRSMARSFHAAAQARAFAQCRHDESPEEVFVAALLMNIGEMAFWSVAQPEAVAIDRMTASGASVREAEEHVLGFRLETLTRRLVDVWRLGGLLEATLADDASQPRTAGVRLGHQVAEAVEQFGWDSREVRQMLTAVEAYLGLNAADASALVQNNVDEAAKIAARYGVGTVERYLLRDEVNPLRAQQTPRPEPVIANPERQLDVLQQITAELEAGSQLDKLLTLVLTGITEGVGFDRAYFALLSPDRRSLQMKLARGMNTAGSIGVASADGNLLQVIIESGKALKVPAADRETLATLLQGAAAAWLGSDAFVVMPVSVSAKVLGVLYADNERSRGEISDAAFAGFRHFGAQVALGLGAAAG